MRNEEEKKSDLDFDDSDLKVKMTSELDENNSFVNACVHLLYQINEFRDFILNNDFPLEYKFNIYYELKIVFEKYYKLSSKLYLNKFPKKFRFINNTTLKQELIDLYEKKFVLKDPIDVIYIYINSLHNYNLDLEDFSEINDNQCNNECMAHSLFFLNLVEQSYCTNCNFMGDFYKAFYCNYFFEINAEVLIYELEQLTFYDINDRLFELEKYNYSRSKNMKCNEDCHQPNILTNRIILTSQKYFITNINFGTTDYRTLFNICNISFMIPFMINNDSIFTIYDDRIIKSYYLQSIIVKENNDSYSIIMFDIDKYEWNYYNDMTIMKLKNPNKVIETIIQKQLLPILLFYIEINKEDKNKIQIKDFDELTFAKFILYSKDVDKEKKIYIENEDLKFRKIRPDESSKNKMKGEELKKVLKSLQDNMTRRKNYGDNLIEEEKMLYKMLSKADELEEKKTEEDDNDINNKWKCEKCNKYNKKNVYRCKICNTFNYEAYEEIIHGNNEINIMKNEKNKEEEIKKNKDKKLKMKIKEEYNFKYEPSNKIPCWKCGYLNPYYKLKCNKCRYSINDTEAPTIISIFSTPFSTRNYINKNNYNFDRKSFNDKYISNLEKNSLKEQINYQNSSSIWFCPFCKRENQKSKFCIFCFKNRKY